MGLITPIDETIATGFCLIVINPYTTAKLRTLIKEECQQQWMGSIWTTFLPSITGILQLKDLSYPWLKEENDLCRKYFIQNKDEAKLLHLSIQAESKTPRSISILQQLINLNLVNVTAAIKFPTEPISIADFEERLNFYKCILKISVLDEYSSRKLVHSLHDHVIRFLSDTNIVSVMSLFSTTLMDNSISLVNGLRFFATVVCTWHSNSKFYFSIVLSIFRKTAFCSMPLVWDKLLVSHLQIAFRDLTERESYLAHVFQQTSENMPFTYFSMRIAVILFYLSIRTAIEIEDYNGGKSRKFCNGTTFLQSRIDEILSVEPSDTLVLFLSNAFTENNPACEFNNEEGMKIDSPLNCIPATARIGHGIYFAQYLIQRKRCSAWLYINPEIRRYWSAHLLITYVPLKEKIQTDQPMKAELIKQKSGFYFSTEMNNLQSYFNTNSGEEFLNMLLCNLCNSPEGLFEYITFGDVQTLLSK